MRIRECILHRVELPFRAPFRHAAHSRDTSASIFLECVLEDGTRGFGESLPRPYVTGEDQDTVWSVLKDEVLPRLLGFRAESLDALIRFLQNCDGSPPQDWRNAEGPAHAAWSAVDLSLLDAYGKSFRMPLRFPTTRARSGKNYSAVLSMGSSLKMYATALYIRWLGFNEVKVKVGTEPKFSQLSHLTRLLGANCSLRLDANMAWRINDALRYIQELRELGVTEVEQPFPVTEEEAAAELNRSGLKVIADESISSRDSLEQLIQKKACSSVNIRISKCGGIVAALERARQAQGAGLGVQIGCQVGESSLLSAANLLLLHSIPDVLHAEGCFGKLLLQCDPATPLLQFQGPGRPPKLPDGAGLGVTVNTEILKRYSSHSERIS